MKVAPGHIGFTDFALPGVEPGAYELVASQKMTMKAASIDETTPEVVTPFIIAGHRFQIPPDEIYSVFPAPGSPPGHAGTFPNVVLARTTLPWERRLDGKSITAAPPEPWLALIVLSSADFDGSAPPGPVARKAAELLAPGDGIRGPVLTLDGIETDESPCSTIDLPVDLARAVLPTRADLPLLAHVREVRTDHKETWSHLTDGRFAVVTANRIPPPAPEGREAAEALCVLISLEGHAELLDRDARLTETTARLAVLGSWRYQVGPIDPVAAALKHIDSGLLVAPAPDTARKTAADRARAEALTARTGLGFVLLRHRTRVGASTASWYRGPLAPRSPPTSGIDVIEIEAADRMLTWDPAMGAFETSQAAAWQVGRLVALQNAPAASAISRYRRGAGAAMRRREEAAELRAALKETPPADLSLLFPDPAPVRDAAEIEDALHVPEEIVEFAARLSLLYGVPLEYLLPHESLLPDGAIRFFHLDRWWIASMLQGALGIGRTISATSAADTRLRHAIFDKLPLLARGVRNEIDGNEPHPDFKSWKATGFLLRSPAVAAWLGLECEVVGLAGDETKTLTPLRIDRLRPNLLLCLYEGEITELSIRQPSEGIHFGATRETDGTFTKSLRGPIGEKKPKTMGDLAFAAKPGAAPGVIDIADLAAGIGAATGSAMSSGVMAHYLIEAPIHLTISGAPLKETGA